MAKFPSTVPSPSQSGKPSDIFSCILNKNTDSLCTKRASLFKELGELYSSGSAVLSGIPPGEQRPKGD